MTLDAPPRRRLGESNADYRARVQSALNAPTNFSEALKPQLGGTNPTSGPLAQTGPQTHSWDKGQEIMGDTRTALLNLRNTGSLSGAVAAMPVTPPPPLFSNVTDDGIPAPLGTNPPFTIRTGVTPISAVDMLAGNAPRSPSSRFGVKSFNANGGNLRVLNTPYGRGESFAPFGVRRRPNNFAQASGLPF